MNSNKESFKGMYDSLVDPYYLYGRLVEEYPKLLSEFKSKVLQFKYLSVNESFYSANMYIKLIDKDTTYDDCTLTFWWHHSQNCEMHLIELHENEDVELTIRVHSSIYNIQEKSHSELNELPFIELVDLYKSLHSANSWFVQLTDSLEIQNQNNSYVQGI